MFDERGVWIVNVVILCLEYGYKSSCKSKGCVDKVADKRDMC